MYEPSKFYYDRTALGGVETSTSSEVFDHEIAHLTKLRSGPSKPLSKMVNGKRKNLISPVKMLAAREANYLRRSKFSSADCCHLLSRYLPSYGPFMVDRMESRAYVSQFSGDGSLLVAGFQDSNIRVYNAENGWNLQKDILAKSLRWTITDTYLSPDQRYLVYSSMSPIVHIVNVGSPVTKAPARQFKDFDYRWMEYPPKLKGIKHPNDQSLTTYRGHSVLRTLIRCHFSPEYSTGQKHIYTGSNDGAVYI